jgi:hypothetical protein
MKSPRPPVRLAKIFLLVTLIFALRASPAHSQGAFPYEYDWTGGQNGYYGVLYLDMAASSTGSLSDIGPDSYFQTPNSWSHLSFWSFSTSYSSFTWNAQQITAMFIGFSFGTVQGYIYENQSGQNGVAWHNSSTVPALQEIDASGNWLAVPEPGSARLLGLAGVVVLGCRSRSGKNARK